jgi:hypothetical protein
MNSKLEKLLDLCHNIADKESEMLPVKLFIPLLEMLQLNLPMNNYTLKFLSDG